MDTGDRPPLEGDSNLRAIWNPRLAVARPSGHAELDHLSCEHHGHVGARAARCESRRGPEGEPSTSAAAPGFIRNVSPRWAPRLPACGVRPMPNW